VKLNISAKRGVEHISYSSNSIYSPFHVFLHGPNVPPVINCFMPC